MPVTEQQARAIAFLAAMARPHGARRWDEAGIYANVMKVADRSLSSVVIAVMQAAEDRNATTPGVIPKPGPHWRAPEPELVAPMERPRFDPRKVCTVCAQTEAVCREAHDHPFVSIEQARSIRSVPVPAEIRGAIAAKTAVLCRHGVARDHCADHKPPAPDPRAALHGAPTEETP